MYVAKKNLFDLIRDDLAEEKSSIYLDEKAYIENIVHDIGQLLNTRCILPKSKRRTHLPLNYGLPYAFGMQEPDDIMHPEKQKEWKAALERTLRYFEPRLVRPKITILNIDIQRQMMNIEIKGSLCLNDELKRVHFSFPIHNPY
ncbi:MAG: type VI secretion system baseplate subunit TssE [Alphaproteobacteria bacterium]|nr:type VI secretion system baseplate subunit TssE [Alphaproteobacteria bacterium]